jgi:hypothetical protein
MNQQQIFAAAKKNIATACFVRDCITAQSRAKTEKTRVILDGIIMKTVRLIRDAAESEDHKTRSDAGRELAEVKTIGGWVAGLASLKK